MNRWMLEDSTHSQRCTSNLLCINDDSRKWFSVYRTDIGRDQTYYDDTKIKVEKKNRYSLIQWIFFATIAATTITTKNVPIFGALFLELSDNCPS